MFGLLSLAYVGIWIFGGSSLSIGKWTFDLPPLWVLPVHVGLATADLRLTSTVLYLLLRVETFASSVLVVAVYLVVPLLGIISHVLGRLVIFDGTDLALLTTPKSPLS